MNTPYRQPRPGHYRLPSSIRIVPQDESAVAVCDYPLRLVRLNTVTAHLLSLCAEERTCEQLAQAINIPVRRVETLCDQLRWKGLLEAGSTLPPPTWPNVSIVVPAYNRARELERCLRSLFTLDYPAHCLEIIVVDDTSTDETSSMLRRMAREAAARGLEMRVVCHEQRQGVGISRNTGAGAARHDLIAYLDSDCVASPGWLRELVPAFQDERVAAVGGMIRAYDRKSLLGRYEDVRSSLFMGMQPQQVRLEGPLTYLPTANMLLRRAAWQQLSGFAPMTQGEDVDFCRRLLISGASMRYLPQGVVYHDYRTTLGAFLRIRFAYASAEAPLLQRHPTERRILLLPPKQATFAGALIMGAWSSVPPPAPRRGDPLRSPWGGSRGAIHGFAALLSLLLTLFLILFGTCKRLQKVREQRMPIGFFGVFKATLRGHLAYTYLLCRHLTRYYTLPLLVVSLLVPPLFLLTCILCGIVIGIDYWRLRPEMGLGWYALCSLLDDCAYEVGVVWGCVKHRTWKPLVPVVKKQL
ncbi:MAG TPA: mycofactocin biosynthesis glycosyltransferase MftF [Ktedonobacteraceae bacterium]|nr:mycofactocin biosynthesis glycosyltransferase MftF [Ktedonobacteraceae bacterium]